MNKIKIIWIILHLTTFVVMPTFADEECSQSFGEAKALYSAGKYQAAREMFEYVQELCGSTYGSANTWIQKCNQAMNAGSKSSSSSRPQQSSTTIATTLSASQTQVDALASGTTVYIRISSNKNWRVVRYPDSWCQITNLDASGFNLIVSDNPNTNVRNTSLYIETIDSKKNLTININQAAKKTQTTTKSSSSNTSSNSSSATLSLSKTYITASAAGTTEYITVTSNRDWEIQYPSASMYIVTKISDTSVKVVIHRNTGDVRQDFFNIKTTDGSKIVKVSLSQGQGSSSSSSSNYSNSNYSRSSYRSYSSGYRALDNFNTYQGKWEVDWASARMAICTGYEMEVSAFAFRYSVLKIEPLVFGYRYDFIQSYESFYYQPDVKLVFPWDMYHAVEFGIGPSISGAGVWFTTELGILWHWGDLCSSDFFIRYDGMFTFGASINFSTGFN